MCTQVSNLSDPRCVSDPVSLAAVGLFMSFQTLHYEAFILGFTFQNEHLRSFFNFFYCASLYKKTNICKAMLCCICVYHCIVSEAETGDLFKVFILRLELSDLFSGSIQYLNSFNGLTLLKQCPWMSVMFIFFEPPPARFLASQQFLPWGTSWTEYLKKNNVL